jgi:DNA modification methylase
MDPGQIFNLDVLEFLKGIETGSADMVFADPEYNINPRGGRFDEKLRDWLDYFDWVTLWLDEARRILKDTGSIFLKCPARTSGYYQVQLQHIGFEYRNQIILSVPVHPARRSFLSAHEVLWFYSVDSKKSYFNPTGLIRAKEESNRWWYKEKFRDPDGDRINSIWLDIKWLCAGSLFSAETILAPGSRMKAHPNQMNSEIAERAILFTTRPGDLVIDLFTGSGTVPFVANKLGRRYLATDINPLYVKLARVRCGQSHLEFSPNELAAMENQLVVDRESDEGAIRL